MQTNTKLSRMGAPLWANCLIDTYFENNPPEETMKWYKENNALCYQYWYHELKRILNSKLHVTDPSFIALSDLEVLRDKYPSKTVISIKEMAHDDRKAILTAFCNGLGMHIDIFPFRVDNFA